MTTIVCGASWGEGGIGRHLEAIVEAALQEGDQPLCLLGAKTSGYARAQTVARPVTSRLARFPPIRSDPRARTLLANAAFDRAAARELAADDIVIAFSGQCLRTLKRARRLGAGRIVLVSPTNHITRVARAHERARALYPIERSWLSSRLVERCLREYEIADVIQVSSTQARDSFVAEGVPGAKIEHFTLTPDRRFHPGPRRRADGVMRIVYVGSLSVAKGVPVLLDAFARLERKATLTLVGGWSTRTMRQFIERRTRDDSRILAITGDPLPHLRAADVFVHPSFDDGFGLAPAEALACGVPVIVTTDTGMKELIKTDAGVIVPSGDVTALVKALGDVRIRT